MFYSSELSSTRQSYSLFSCRMNFGRICFGLVAIVFMLPAPKSQAQIVDWSNTTNDAPWYDVGANWIGGTAPTGTQTARFNQAATYNVLWDNTTTTNTPSVGFLDIQQGDVTFLDFNGNEQHLFTINGSGGNGSFSDFSVSGAETKLTSRGLHLRSQGGGQILNGATLTLDGSHQNGSKLTVNGTTGFDVSGNLNVQSGAIFENSVGYIGQLTGSTGKATVTGSGSQWNNSSFLDIGTQGNGTLNVQAGGVVSNADAYIGFAPGSTGKVTVTGSGSHWNNSGNLFAGNSGNGDLNIEAGGLVSSTTGSIGYNVGSIGKVTVTGSGSRWNNSNSLVTGDFGNGTLNVQAGGVVSNTRGIIGFIAGSTGKVTVTGSGSQWNSSSFVEVGSSGNGTLDVQAGGVVSNTTGHIGRFDGSTGKAAITGTGSKWNSSGGLLLGGTSTANGGMGTLNIQDSGQVNVGNDRYSGSSAALTISDSGTNGNLWVRNGSVITNSGIGLIGLNSGSSGKVTVTGSGSQWNNSSFLDVGSSGKGTLDVQAGGVVSNASGFIGFSAGSTGKVTVTGSGSQWNSSGGLFSTGLFLGGTSTANGGMGTLDIQNGGRVNVGNDRYSIANNDAVLTISDSGSNGNLWVRNGSTITNGGASYIGLNSGSTGIATVTGSGSQWNNSRELFAGYFGDGDLNIEAGGMVSNDAGYIGFASGSTGKVTVTGSGSQWNGSIFYVGNAGNGTLDVQAGGVVSNGSGYIGIGPGSTGKATVTGSGSQWNSRNFLSLGGNLLTGTENGGMGTLNIQDSGQVNIGNDRYSGSSAALTVSDSGASGDLWVGNGSIVTNSGFSFIGLNAGSTGKVTVSGSGSQWNNSNFLYTGYSGNGTLNVEAGGKVTNVVGRIGDKSNSKGSATVTGGGSQWNNSGSLHVGFSGDGTLNVEAGGVVTSVDGLVGRNSGSIGTATVTGSGSQWSNSRDFLVGNFGSGKLDIVAGGVVSNTAGYIGLNSGSTGKATVTGSGSKWTNSGNLSIGGSESALGGTGTLTIANSGLVTVGGTTRIWSGSNVNLTGGRFQFGQTTLQEFGRINAVSGSMTGDVTHSGYTDVSTLSSLQNSAVDLTGVRVANSGTLYGNGSLGVGLRNNAGGEVETMAGERMRFAGAGSTNAGEINNYGGQIRFDQNLVNQTGEINNFGGQIRFEQSLVNQTGGLIGGRGQFFANGGWTNSGIIAMSGGFADVHGDLVNNAGGKIAIGGGSTTTFYDDVTMDASNLNMDIASNSYGVFFGSYNGGFNGLGTVQAFGDLRPGNSPGIVSFGGDLELGENTATYIELGGLLSGEFDQLLIGDDFLLDGSLNVSLIDDFKLGFNQEFLIADITGTRTGFFDGLSEGDLVGNYGGMDLFISYGAGNGNDISLFTAIPEPGAVGLLSCLMLGWMTRRRRVRA